MERARELWSSIMAEGHGNEAVMWLEYLQLERLVVSGWKWDHFD